MGDLPAEEDRHRRLMSRGSERVAQNAGSISELSYLSPQTLLKKPPLSITLHWQDRWTLTWFTVPRTAGYAVALTWLTLFVSGRWAADRGWLDRLGRLLGTFWIAQGSLSVAGRRGSPCFDAGKTSPTERRLPQIVASDLRTLIELKGK